MHTLITGVTGQDGSYLAELLTRSGQPVSGLIHPHEQLPEYLQLLADQGQLTLIACDLHDPGAFRHVLRETQPTRVFHLAALSQPLACERDPQSARQVNVVSCEVLTEWLRRDLPAARALLASSATIFGNAAAPQHEGTAVQPQGEYARQKLAVRELAEQARQDGLFCACVIPFNHESERRPEDFVFAKVCNSVARIARGQQLQLRLGALSTRRDWGYAPEFAQAMAWMLEVEHPLDLVLGTGESHSVEELARAACAAAGVDFNCVETDARTAGEESGPQELRADPRRAWQELGWEAETRFAELVRRMTAAALSRLD